MVQQLITLEIKKIKDYNSITSNDIKVYLILLLRLIKLGFNFVLSRLYLHQVNSMGRIVFTRGRPKVINKGKIEIGNLVRIWSNVNRVRLSIGKHGYLRIGNNTRINGATISVQDEVLIGDNCRIAPHVIIMDGDFHGTVDRLSEGKKSRIIIEDNAWVATRAMILKGVTIGHHAVVAAGSVVTKDVAPYSFVAGVPAKVKEAYCQIYNPEIFSTKYLK